MNPTNNESARMSYNIARELLYAAMRPKFKSEADANAWVAGCKLSQSEIRLEVELNTTSNTFVFGVTDQQRNSSNVTFPTERRLTLQDTLIVADYAFYVANSSGETDTEFELFTHGNPIAFPAAGAAAAINSLFANGFFQLKANNDVIIPYRGLYNHLYKGETQQTAVVGAGSPEDQIRGSEDGFITQEPNLLFIGSKNYVPSIVLPANMLAVQAGMRAVLIFRGILAQNSTVVN